MTGHAPVHYRLCACCGQRAMPFGAGAVPWPWWTDTYTDAGGRRVTGARRPLCQSCGETPTTGAPMDQDEQRDHAEEAANRELQRNPDPGRVVADPDDFSELCLVLGGSADSWTGQALLLIDKSDPVHRSAMRRAFPVHVTAWEAWQLAADGKGAGVRAARDVVAAFGQVIGERGGVIL